MQLKYMTKIALSGAQVKYTLSDRTINNMTGLSIKNN